MGKLIKKTRKGDFGFKNRPITSNGLDAVAKDAFSNAAARMGYGTPSVAEDTDYQLIRWTNYYWLMITLFRNHWIARRIVELPAQDMTKNWAKLQCDLDPKEIKKFDRTIDRTMTQHRIRQAITWARLFGGAGSLIVIDGQENMLSEPLDLDSIAPGSYKGLITFDRWSGINPQGQIGTDINSPVDFGFPEYYTVTGTDGNDIFDIHHSRILRFTGPNVPNPEYAASMYWGISVLEITFEELRKRDNASWSILNLLFRAQILTQVNPELGQMLSGASSSAASLQKFQQVYQQQNELLSNQSMLIMGKDSKLESHQYTFGGVPDLMDRFEYSISGAARIPYSKLFMKQTGSMGGSNEADERNYEQDIAQSQHEELRPQLDKLYPVIAMSEWGEVPDDLDMVFPSVRVLTEEQKSTLQKDGSTAIVEVFNAGIRTQRKTLLELKKLGELTGIGETIDDEEIAKASDEIQVPLEVESEEARAGSAEFEETE